MTHRARRRADAHVSRRFRTRSRSPTRALALTGVFVVVSQFKINVTNAYAGSIAWSNFFSRLTHSHPGRVVWLIFNVMIALLLMELGVYKALEQTSALYSTVAVAWVGALVADLVVNKPLGLSPPHIEFKRAHLYDINPVGVGAMACATIVSVAALYGAFGPALRRFAPFIALFGRLRSRRRSSPRRPTAATTLPAEPRRAWRTIDDPAAASASTRSSLRTWRHCPAYAGPICSLCCSLDARCHDMLQTACADSRRSSPTRCGRLLPALLSRRLEFRARPLSRRLRGYLPAVSE